jgi:hypothetical protein
VLPTLSLGDVGFKIDLGDSRDDCWGQSTAGSIVDEEMVGDGGTCPPYRRGWLCIVFAACQQTLGTILGYTGTSDAGRTGCAICI